MAAQPRPPERLERYLAGPCSGRMQIGNQTEHVYLVLDYDHPSKRVISRGWMTPERINELYGNENVFYSKSHGLCPPCGRSLDEEIDSL